MRHKVYIDGETTQVYGDLESGDVFRFLNGKDDNVYIKSYLNGHAFAVQLNSGTSYQPTGSGQVIRSKRGDKVAISVGMG